MPKAASTTKTTTKTSTKAPKVEDKDKKKKVKKDPNAPKGAKSAYLFFCEDKWAETKAEASENKENVMKLLGPKWKALSEEDKEPYKEQNLKDKVRYDTEMAEWKKGKENVGKENVGSDDSNYSF